MSRKTGYLATGILAIVGAATLIYRNSHSAYDNLNLHPNNPTVVVENRADKQPENDIQKAFEDYYRNRQPISLRAKSNGTYSVVSNRQHPEVEKSREKNHYSDSLNTAIKIFHQKNDISKLESILNELANDLTSTIRINRRSQKSYEASMSFPDEYLSLTLEQMRYVDELGVINSVKRRARLELPFNGKKQKIEFYYFQDNVQMGILREVPQFSRWEVSDTFDITENDSTANRSKSDDAWYSLSDSKIANYLGLYFLIIDVGEWLPQSGIPIIKPSIIPDIQITGGNDKSIPLTGRLNKLEP